MDDYQSRLQPFGKLYFDYVKAIREKLSEMTDEELKQIYKDCCNLTKTNCWWATYGTGPEVKKWVKNNLLERDSKKEVNHD